MAAYNFPNSPSDGDTVTSNGITYTYSSSKTRWDGAAPSGSSTTVYATIDLLPLSGASTGDQAYVSGNNRLYIWNGTGWYNIALVNTTPSISGANASYALATDGTATTVTITATDPEGIPITYSIASDTSGNVATVTQGTGANTNVFTITPSTNTANAGTFSLTFRASDGVNIATAVSSFTLVFSIQNSNYTTALITSVGANNAVNNSFDDASTNNHTITANGNVTQNTFSPYRHGGNAVSFAGTNSSSENYLWINAAIVPATGSWTYESWVRVDRKSDGERHSLISWYTNSVSGRGNIFVRADNETNPGIVFVYVDGMSAYPQSTTRIDDSAWHHVVVERDGNVWSVWIDGTREDQQTQNVTINTSVNTRLGHIVNTSATSHSGLKGLMRDVRFSTSARYQGAATITVPTEDQTTTTGYALLCCQSFDPFTDKTGTREITVYSSTSVKQVGSGPYDHNGYSASSHGGSMYFDGSGDRLDVGPDNSFLVGTGSVTMECWCYPTAVGQDAVGDVLMLIWSGTNNAVWLSYTSTKKFNFRIGYQGGSTAMSFDTTNTYALNQWHHVAVVRNSSDNSAKIYVNGVNDGSSTNSTDLTSTYGSDVDIGAQGAGRYFQGHITDARIVNGTAVYTADFTPPTAPLTAITNTSLLLNGTDAGIIDKSQSVKTITLNGDVKSSTTQSKYLTSSMYFDGTGDYVEAGDVSLPADFTVEYWLYNGTSGNNFIFQIGDSYTASGLETYIGSSGASFNLYSNQNSRISSSSKPTVNGWAHVAIVRSGSTVTLYLDGTSLGTWSSSAAFSGTVRIGAEYYNGSITGTLTGYMSDVRITKGLARYTANFTPPSAALQG